MKKQKNKKLWFKKSLRIVGMNPTTYDEFWRLKINNLQIVSIALLIMVITFFFNYALFSYTPLGYILPENIKNRNKQKIELAAKRVVVLEQKVITQDNYISNLQKIILGEMSMDSIYSNAENASGPTLEELYIHIDTTSSEAEAELDRNLKLKREKLAQKQDKLIDHLYLFDPVKGEISQKFKNLKHPGVDIVTAKEAQIKACLDGVVLHSNYNNIDGYTIIISHKNNLISVYKHAQTVYVKVGDVVETGETIGVVGSTGEGSTGPHLHFELWTESGPLDPMSYFSFGK